MSWNNPTRYPFDRPSINTNAPDDSGVYALYKGQRWIYIGESEHIRRRLHEHSNSPTPCIRHEQPSHFRYELVAGAAQRLARQNQLIAELRPVCN